MRAVRSLRGGGRWKRSCSRPRPGRGEVLVDIRSAGICHSDAHYRADASRVRCRSRSVTRSPASVPPSGRRRGGGPSDRVALHYLLANGDMIGKERDGGYAARIVVPAENAAPVPAEVPFAQAAIMMCSTATALHALRVASFASGESVAILGFGGLGVSALQLLRVLGAGRVVVVEPVAEKRRLAVELGATPVEAGALRDVDVALDFAGHEATTLAALRGLAMGGRLVLVAINLRTLTIDPYADVLARERRILGCADHTRGELVELMELARRGALDLSRAVSRVVPLQAGAIDTVLDSSSAARPFPHGDREPRAPRS